MKSRRKAARADAQKVGAEIKRRREAMCLTLAGLAHFAEIHPLYLSKIEKGRVDVGLGVLTRIARALYCQPAELLGPVKPLSPAGLVFARMFDGLPDVLQAALLAILRAANRARGSR